MEKDCIIRGSEGGGGRDWRQGTSQEAVEIIQTRGNEGQKHPTAVHGEGAGTGPPGPSLQVGCLSRLRCRGHRWLIHGNTRKHLIFN